MRMESLVVVLALLVAIFVPQVALAQLTVPEGVTPEVRVDPAPPLGPSLGLPDLTKRESFSSALQIIILLTVLSLAPAILIMMTSFTRLVIVLSLLRQALGTQNLPPSQVMIGLALFMTFLIMGPTLSQVNDKALQPYMRGEIEQPEALSRAQIPVREFMQNQII